MSKQLMLGLFFVSACAPKAAVLSTASFCQQPKPAPSGWKEVAVPASAATLRLPSSYVSEANAWRGPRGGSIATAWHPHRQARPRAPDAIRAGGPECHRQLGDHTVSLERWAEFPGSGANGIQIVTVARWEEMPGTDVALIAIAMDTKEQLEQLRILHTLGR